MHELILGGQKSGKSRCAEQRAAAWLAQPGRRAVFVATALAGDDEMRTRIERHRQDRARHLPTLVAVEEPSDLAGAIGRHSEPACLVVVDCLTLWLTNWLMPLHRPIHEPIHDPMSEPTPGDRTGGVVDEPAWAAQRAALIDVLGHAHGPLVLVSNEIGLGLTPMGAEARRFVDELGRLHQDLAQRCSRVTLMVAGLPLAIKSESAK